MKNFLLEQFCISVQQNENYTLIDLMLNNLLIFSIKKKRATKENEKKSINQSFEKITIKYKKKKYLLFFIWHLGLNCNLVMNKK